MKKAKKFITLEEAFSMAYFSGMRVGFSLGEFPSRIAPKLAGRSQDQMERIFRVEINRVFKDLKKRGK